MAYKWKPSKAARAAFAEKMSEIDTFIRDHNITASSSSDSYYFSINGVHYRVSNHSPESSPYHNGRMPDVRYIHAGKTRIIEIYNALVSGKHIDGHGFVID